jgi:uncharacterized membrane protein YccC
MAPVSAPPAETFGAAQPDAGWRGVARRKVRQLAAMLRSAAPMLLFGLRLWAAVSLAVYVAFWLQLDNPFWAGTSAATVCQPSVGASLRKGWFRMIGTVVGAVAIVVLTSLFVQQRVGFLLGLALWGAGCGLVATLLRNFASYAAALAGYTVAIIAGDELGAVGGANGDAFMLAVTRASEICIGIVCAGIVLAGTDFGGVRQRLAGQLGALTAEITRHFCDTVRLVGVEQRETRETRRELARRVIALDPTIDAAFGESSALRDRRVILRGAVAGLLASLAAWRLTANHLELRPEARRAAALITETLPAELRAAPLAPPADDAANAWLAAPARLRRICGGAMRALIALPAHTPSSRLLADQAAAVLAGIAQALDALALLVDDPGQSRRRRGARIRVPDWLPALVNAARVFAVIGAVELFWIVTAWPGGASAITFAALAVILFSPRAEQAYATAMGFMTGVTITTVLAAIIKFALLPNVETYVTFCLATGLVLVPAGALMAQPRHTVLFLATAVLFTPLLAPANPMSYDTQEFYNSALSIVSGVGVAALSFRLIPPVSPALRTRRLLWLTLRDLRRLTREPIPATTQDWESRTMARVAVLPEAAEPVERAQLLAALSLGTEIIRLRRIARWLDVETALAPVLTAITAGESRLATAHLAALDQLLAALPPGRGSEWLRLRTRASLLAMSEALTQHSAYFGEGESR